MMISTTITDVTETKDHKRYRHFHLICLFLNFLSIKYHKTVQASKHLNVASTQEFK